MMKGILQFITHRTDRFTEIEGARIALQGGCRWIQLRAKDSSLTEVAQMAIELLPLCRQYQAKLIINDHPELVYQVGAHGVHLGQDDMPISDARRLLGPDAIIGGTAHTYEEVVAHKNAGADYAGVGPFHFTSTKKNLRTVLGIDGYLEISQRLAQAGISIPIIGIGGITLDDVAPLMHAHLSGVAVSGSILQADNPEACTTLFLQKLIETSTY